MKRLLKWIGIILGVLVGLVIIVAGFGLVRANSVLAQSYDFPPDAIAIPTDAGSVAHGQYLVDHFMLCADCHGDDLGGAEFFNADEGAPGTLWAPNLTAGDGGIGQTYTDADWLQALRHGIRPNGENLIIMPAEFYTTIDSQDIADMIAYLKALPPVDRQTPPRSLELVPKIMMGLGVIPASEFLPAHKIDHTAQPAVAPARGVTVEYGGYLAKVCAACHGEDFSGAPSQGEGSDLTPNLTPGGELATWSEADFLHAMQDGVTPNGKTLDPQAMPWPRIGGADVADLQAIWLYLQSLPALPDHS